MRIRNSKRNDELMDKLKSLYNFEYEGIIPRIAFTYSIQLGKHFDLNTSIIPNADGRDWRDEKGLFGTSIGSRSNYVIYKAILDQHYEKELLEDEFSKLFRLHLDFGLEKMNNDLENKNIAGGYHISYLMKMVKDGLAVLSNKPKIIIHSTQTTEIEEFNNLIEFDLGTDENSNPIKIRLNDLNELDSHHIAIAGMNGSGKTELIKDILYQISIKTQGKLKFIFFDYKGEKREKLEKFLTATNCNFIDVLKDKYEFNPLSIINSNDENERNIQIQAFSDIICGIANLGTRQSITLRKVIRDFIEENKNKTPTIEDIYECLQLYYEESKIKPDTLIDIFDKLSNGLFSEYRVGQKNIYEQNIYLNLPNHLPDTVRQLTVFFTLKYLLNVFTSLNDTQPDENKIKPMRYVIVVDEAHIYLKNKNARKALEDLLRMVRSKGVIVVMLSQGAEDYRQKDFDFSSQVKIPICLNVKNKDYKIMEHFLGTPSSKYKLEQAIDKLQSGFGVINLKEAKKFEIRQFWKTINNITN